MLTKENICAIIITHSPEEGFISNLSSVKEQVAEVVIVNNGSEKLASGFFEFGEKVYLVNNSGNFGQGKALNQGIKWAVAQGYQWVLLLDQDSLIEPSMVQELISAYQNCPFKEKVKIIGSNCIYKNTGEIKYQKECWARSFFERDVVMMSGILLSLDVYNAVGPFREEFFIDSIDADYCLRLRKNRFRIIVACRAKMTHSVGENGFVRKFLGKKLLITNHCPERCYFMTRNGLILVKEYFFQEPYWAFRRIVWYFLVKPGLVVLYEKDKIKKLKSITIGIYHALIKKTGRRR